MCFLVTVSKFFECNLEKNMHEWVFKNDENSSEGWVQFEVFEKLTSVFFFKLDEKPYLLIIYMKKLCSHVCKSHLEIKNLRKLRNLKNKKLRKLKKLKWKSSPFCASVLLITMWGPSNVNIAQIANVSNFSEHKLYFIFI
jgi:hypothetical protein